MSERSATSATACSSMTALAILPLCFLFNQQRMLHVMACSVLTCASVALAAPQAAETARPPSIDRETLDQWTAPYRGWHYHPEHVIPAQPNIPGYEGVASSDDGLTWRRAKKSPILAVQDPGCRTWEQDCVYQP